MGEGHRKENPAEAGSKAKREAFVFMALWLVPEPSTEELLAAQYSCPIQVVPDQLWSVCSP